MVFKETPFKLKDGRDALLRSPCEKDADEIFGVLAKRMLTKCSNL